MLYFTTHFHLRISSVDFPAKRLTIVGSAGYCVSFTFDITRPFSPKIKATIVVVVLFFSSPTQAANTTGAFLKIPVGARQVGMGQAFTAVANDVNSAWWNPAGLGRLGMREFSATDAQLFGDMRFETLAYAQPVRSGALGLSVGYLSHKAIEGRGPNREKTGSFGASDMVLGMSYGRPYGALHIGGTLKYLKSSIADASATGAALDVGALMPTKVAGLTVGAALQNLGTGMRFIEERNPLPMSLSLGAAYQTPFGTVSADLKREMADDRMSFSLGMEMQILSALTARAGYQKAAGTAFGTDQSSPLAGLAGGLGIRILGYTVDYSFTPMGELGAAQRLSLTARF